MTRLYFQEVSGGYKPFSNELAKLFSEDVVIKKEDVILTVMKVLNNEFLQGKAISISGITIGVDYSTCQTEGIDVFEIDNYNTLLINTWNNIVNYCNINLQNCNPCSTGIYTGNGLDRLINALIDAYSRRINARRIYVSREVIKNYVNSSLGLVFNKHVSDTKHTEATVSFIKVINALTDIELCIDKERIMFETRKLGETV